MQINLNVKKHIKAIEYFCEVEFNIQSDRHRHHTL